MRLQNGTSAPSAQTTSWRTVSTGAELAPILLQSHERPVILFKHSRACSVSQRALDHLRRHLELVPGSPAYVVTVQDSPRASEAIERMFTIPHETPQAIVVEAGRAIWHGSHHEITVGALAAATGRALPG